MPSMQAERYSIPDCENDPEKWNDAWERILKFSRPSARAMVDSVKTAVGRDFDRDNSLVVYSDRLRMILERQRTLAAYVKTALVRDDLEAKWIGCGEATRRKHILEGLVRTCMMFLMEDYRMQCPDITVDALQKANGRGFLTLLTHYLPAGEGPPLTEAIYYDDTVWGTIFSPAAAGKYEENVLIQLKLARLGREKFISHVSWHVLESFAGKPRNPNANSERVRPKDSLNKNTGARAMLKETLTETDYKALKAQLQTGRKEGIRRCDYCSKAVEHKLVCIVCNSKQGRKVSYCSKDCQRADWKRHKLVCGKEMTLDSAHATATSRSESYRIGPATDGYERSAYLSNQVDLCNLYSHADYLIPVPGDIPHSFKLHTPLSPFFRTYRNKAMTTGDEDAIGVISHQLMRHCTLMDLRQRGDPDIDAALVDTLMNEPGNLTFNILEQLRKEYDVNVMALAMKHEFEAAKDQKRRSRLEIEAGYEE